MSRRRVIPSLLIIAGVLAGLITVFGFVSEYGRIDPGQPELAATLILFICLGFVLTGVAWLRPSSVPTSHQRVPALVLVVLGFLGITGGMLVLSPWLYDGLAGGLRGILMFVFVVLGAAFGLAGWRWYRERELRYPLAVQSGGLALGLFYLTHQQLDLLIDIPVLAIVVVLVVAVPVVGVLYGIQPMASGH